MAVLKLVNVSRSAAARITTGVSHRLRSIEGASSKEGESTDDIAKPPNNAHGGNAMFSRCFCAESGRPVKSDDIPAKKLIPF